MVGTLWLGSNHVADDGAAAFGAMIRRNTRLRALGLWNNGIGCAGARAIDEGMRSNRAISQVCESGVTVGRVTGCRFGCSHPPTRL